jgi:hypothetical protein
MSGLAASLVLSQRPALVASDKRDQALAVVCIRACDHPDDKLAIQQELIDLRNQWRTWLTIKQREWQQKTRRQSRARHHDSVAIRERYVRF